MRRMERLFLNVVRVLVIATITTVGVVFLQLVYPSSTTTPLLRSNGTFVGGMGEGMVSDRLAKRHQLPVSIQAEQHTYQISLEEAGVTIDTDKTVAALTGYSLKERLIPFSIFRRSKASAVAMQYDDAKLTALAEKIAAENVVKPKSATVRRTTKSYAVDTPSTTGISYEVEKIVAALKDVQPGIIASLSVPATTTEPSVTTEEAQNTIVQLNRQTNQKTYLAVGGEKFLISRDQLKKFITINYDEKRDVLSSRYNKKAIRSFVKSVAPKVYVEPVASKVRVHDGQTISATSAKTGQMLNEDEAVKAIIAGLKKTSSNISVKPQKISLNTIFARSYSKSNRGLQILIQDWQSDTGLSTGVVVRELTGKRRSANLNGSQSFLSASIAKLYLTHYLYNGIEKGSWSSGSKFGTSSTVGSCIQAMIVVSNNECFHAIGANRGWSNVTNFAWSKGFSSTNPNPSVYTTTANDTASYMQQLYNGSLVGNTHRPQLLGYMRSQIYRSAIPAGSRGAVADKPGFWGGYWHDAAIVYHPKTTYVLVVMTSGGSPSQIADLSARISNYMNK